MTVVSRTRRGSPTARLLSVYSFALLLFVLAPLLAIATVSLTSADSIAFPPPGLSLRWYEQLARDPGYTGSFVLSVVVGLVAASIATLIGTAASLAIARNQFRGRTTLSLIFLTPLSLPRIVFGLALLVFVSRLALPSTIVGVIIGHVVIGLPFVMSLVGAALSGADRNLELAARSLGASPARTFRLITLPLIRNGMVAGAAFAAIASYDDIAVALFLTAPPTTTLPVRMFLDAQFSFTPLITAAATASIVVTVGALVVLAQTSGLVAGIPAGTKTNDGGRDG